MKYLSLLILAFFFILNTTSVSAQTIIRDAEIEIDLMEMSAPILRNARLNPSQVQIILVQDNAINAFVAAGQNIFLNAGLIMEADNIGELIGVIAHEAGHISGGHLVRFRDSYKDASLQTVLSTILATTVAVASGSGEAASGVLLGGNEIGRRTILKHSRGFEASADQAALRYLAASGYSAKGLETFLEKLAKQELLPESQQSEYIRTHPITFERVETVKAIASQRAEYDTPLPEDLQDKFARMRAKIVGYVEPDRALREYSNDNTIEGLYARAIASYRRGITNEALQYLDQLIRREPQNPYFHELKGQILFENGDIPESVEAYKLAVDNISTNHRNGLIKTAYAQALLARQDNGVLDLAIRNLIEATSYERRSPRLHRLLATAYGRKGSDGLAKLHLAEEAFLINDFVFATQQAQLATQALDKKSAGHQRAQDLLLLIKNRKNKG